MMILPEGMKKAVLAMESGEWKVQFSSEMPEIEVCGGQFVGSECVPGYLLWSPEDDTLPGVLMFMAEPTPLVFSPALWRGEYSEQLYTALGFDDIQLVSEEEYKTLTRVGLGAYLKQRVVG
jgi:hypothetical protein